MAICYVDGSHDPRSTPDVQNNRSGWASVVVVGGRKVCVEMGSGNVNSSYSAELEAVILGFDSADRRGVTAELIYTDCYSIFMLFQGIKDEIRAENYHKAFREIGLWPSNKNKLDILRCKIIARFMIMTGAEIRWIAKKERHPDHVAAHVVSGEARRQWIGRTLGNRDRLNLMIKALREKDPKVDIICSSHQKYDRVAGALDLQ